MYYRNASFLLKKERKFLKKFSKKCASNSIYNGLTRCRISPCYFNLRSANSKPFSGAYIRRARRLRVHLRGLRTAGALPKV